MKYGLKAVVSKVGKAGVFEFKIIEECVEDRLLEQEQYWIQKIKPEYNCNTWTPGKRKRHKQSVPRFWVQYHNYDKLGYLPAETLLDECWNEDQEEYEHSDLLGI